MQNIKEKIKYLFSDFLSPREILILIGLFAFSIFFFLVFLYKSSTYIMTDRIVYTGSMHEGVIGSPKNTQPYKPENQADRDLSRLLYSTLIANVENEKFDLRLAEKLEVNSDQTIYKLTLRDDIYFSNGQPITATDVEYSLGFVPMEKNYTLEREGNIFTFKIKKVSSLNFLQHFTYPIIPKEENFDSNYSKSLVTSGSFKIDEIKKDAEGNVTDIFLERYNNGEPKLPYLKKYFITYYKNEVDAYNAFQRKEIDLVSGIPGTTISKIKDDKNIQFSMAPLPNNFAVFLNQNQSELLRENTLRQALSDVIDRESLTNQVLGSFGIPLKNILGNEPESPKVEDIIDKLGTGFIFENGVLYYSTKNLVQTNAKKSDNDKASSKSSKSPVKITLTTIENPELLETAKFLANSWKKLGIETEIKVIDKNNLNSVVKERDFEALLFGFSIKDPKDYYSFFSGKERTYPKLNISNYTSAQVDKILDTLVDEKDPRRIQELTEQLSVQIAKDNPVIVLYKPEFVFTHFLKTKIKLPNTINSEEDRYNFINLWYTDTEKVLNIFNGLRFIDKIDTIFY